MSDHLEYTSSQKRPDKTKWSASIEADKGYLPGRLNKDNGILESDTSIYASNSLDDTVYILVDQYNHQHIKVTINDETVYENTRVIKCNIDDTFKAEIVVDTGYTSIGKLNYTSGKLFKDRHLSIDKEAEAKLCTITIPATTNQTLVFYSIYTIQKSSDTATTFTVPYDTDYSIEIIPEYGYNKGTSNHTELTMYSLNTNSNSLMNTTNFSVNITCTDSTKKKFKITIPTIDNETVSVIANGITYTSTISLDYLTEYKINITPKDNTYVPGRLIYPPVDINSNIPTKRSFTLTKDIDIKITPAYKINDGVFYIQYTDGEKETEPLSDYTDDDWYLKEPYLLANLNHNNIEDLYYLPFSGTTKSGYKHVDDTGSYDFIHDKTGIVPPPLKTYTISITQSDNQKIKVTYCGFIYTDTFKLDPGDNITCRVIPNEGYNAGKLNYTKIDNIQQDYTISATAATIKTFTLTIGETTNQTYVVTINGEAKPSTNKETSYVVNYGSTYSIKYTANASTKAFTYIASESISGVVKSDIIIPAKEAIANIKYYNLIIPSTTNQSYKLSLNTNPDYGGDIPSYNSITKNAQTISVPYGTIYSITYIAEDYYNGGASISGTITDNTTITHNEATIKQATIIITQSANQTIHVYTPKKEGGVDHTSTFTVPALTTYEVEVIGDSGYLPGDLGVNKK